MEPTSDQQEFDVKSLASSVSEVQISSEHDSFTVNKSDTPSSSPGPKDEDGAEDKPKVGMMSESKNLYEGPQKCKCCINWVEEYPEDAAPKLEETEAVQRFALLVRNKKNHKDGKGGAMEVSQIVVQSPLLKKVLERVFEGYQGITASLKQVTFSKPFRPFFHRWEQFQQALHQEEDEMTRSHIQLLYDIISKELEETISTSRDLIANDVITYDYIWTLYKPGDMLYCQDEDEEMIMKLQYSDYEPTYRYRLSVKYVDWDGDKFGWASRDCFVNKFSGTKPITQLAMYPIRFNPDADLVETSLAARGRKFEALQGYHFKAYKGSAELASTHFGTRFLGFGTQKVDGRIIIDAGTYAQFNDNDQECLLLSPLKSTSFAPVLLPVVEKTHSHKRRLSVPEAPFYADPLDMPIMGVPPPPPPPPPMHPLPMYYQGNNPTPPRAQSEFDPDDDDDANDSGYKHLPEDLYPVCNYYVRGYDLKTKQWAKFDVDLVKDITWDDRAFDSLVLPPGFKDLILSFTRNQASSVDDFDDFIEGKGQGIVMLLTGEPGVGKTLTAESVAEHLRVPLYSMSAAQLGVDSGSVEKSLGDILDMVTNWGAILLLDETEVFLEQRTIDGLERNKLVSIFLRMLEYYRGVLFLTTNRVSTLDKALESRIHLKISYPELDRASRLQIWHNLLALLPSSLVGLQDSDLEVLAEKKLNGRQIKNVIKAARLLASEQKTALNLEHVSTVLKITQIEEQFGY